MPRSGIVATSILVGACLLFAAAPARAQPTDWSDKAFFNINLGMQITARPFTEQVTPVIYDERALIAASHPGAGGRLTLDLAGGVRVWRNLGIGGGYTTFAPTETVTVDARIPNPSLFNQPRAASKPTAFTRDESSIHLDAVYVMPMSSRIDIAVSGGPTMVIGHQDFVQTVEPAEAGPPFATVAIGNVVLLRRTGRAYGVHVGGDVTWFVTPLVGIGVTARYIVGSAKTQLSDGRPISIDAGGFQIAWGARIRVR